MIAFVGLSHLSLCTGIALSSTGEDILFLDDDSQKISRLSAQDLGFFEPQLEELFRQNIGRLKFSDDFSELKKAQLVYLAKDIPTSATNDSDYSSTHALLDKIKQHIPTGVSVVIHNQIRPGFCRKIASDFVARGASVYYQVETLIFGQAVSRVLRPERYIIGCADPTTPLPSVYLNLLKKFDCPILTMRYESAELAKLAINIYLCASVSVSNSLSEVAEVVGADWEEIIPVLRLDKRIGPHAYLHPGLGISGGNLERDMVGIQSIARHYGRSAEVVESFLSYGRARKNWALKKLHDHGPNIRTITLLGLAYKKGTTSTKNSPALELLKDLSGAKYQLRLHDPVIESLPSEMLLGLKAQHFTDALSACQNSDALVIMTDWEQFAAIKIDQWLANFKGKLIIDPLGVLKNHSLQGHYIYHRPGVLHA